MDVNPGMTVWSTVFNCNVEVMRVYKSTATVKAWGGGLKAGKQMTFRGQPLDSFQPRKKRSVE